MEVSELKYAKATGVEMKVAYTSRKSESTRNDLFEICSNIKQKRSLVETFHGIYYNSNRKEARAEESGDFKTNSLIHHAFKNLHKIFDMASPSKCE